MRARLGLAALAFVVAADGCAFVYGYGGYSADTTSGGAQGGSSTSSHGTAGSGGANGGGGGSGASGGGGGGSIPFCVKDDQNEPYVPTWVLTFGNGKTSDVAAVNITSAGLVNVAATFKGPFDIGANPVDSTNDAMLVVQIDAGGTPSWAKVFEGSGPVQATAMAVDDSGPHVFGTFTSSVQMPGGPMFEVAADAGAGSSYSFTSLLKVDNGSHVSSEEIPCDTVSLGIPSCSVVIRTARISTMGFAVGGEFLGNAYLDGPMHSNVNGEVASMTLAGLAATLTPTLGAIHNFGTFDPEAPNPAIIETSMGELAFGGNASGMVRDGLCGSTTTTTGEDVFLMKQQSISPPHAWSCPSVFTAAGDQHLDAMAPLPNGSFAVAGRTDGDVNFGSQQISTAGAGVFVGVLDSTETVLWNQKYPIGAVGPVHLEVSDSGNLLLSGTFTGPLPTEGPTVHASKPAGFAMVVDGATGALIWARALLPCPGEQTTSSLVASWSTDGTIAIAGSADGEAQIAGAKVGVKGAKRFFVARFDQP